MKKYAFARAAVRAARELRRKNKKIFSVGITLINNNFPLSRRAGIAANVRVCARKRGHEG